MVYSCLGQLLTVYSCESESIIQISNESSIHHSINYVFKKSTTIKNFLMSEHQLLKKKNMDLKEENLVCADSGA